MAPRVLIVLLAALLAVPLGQALVPAPMPAGSHRPLDATAFQVLKDRLTASNGLLLRTEGNEIFHVQDQMMGVLAFLHMADRTPSEKPAHEASALQLWKRTAAYSPSGRFYYTSVTTESTCIELETNAWALLATYQLAQRLNDQAPELGTRANELSLTLANAVQYGSANGVNVCNKDVTRLPVPLWALLSFLSYRPEAGVDQAVRSTLDKLIQTRFDVAFYGDQPTYNVLPNAQFLIVLIEASNRYGFSGYDKTRDALRSFLTNHSIQTVGGEMRAVSVQRTPDLQAEGSSFPPEAQFWLAYALDLYERNAKPAGGAVLVRGLMSALIDRFWDPVRGGIVPEDGLLHTVYTAPGVLLTSTPGLRSLQVDASAVTILLPARSTGTYPRSADADASRYLLSNELSARFDLRLTSADRGLLAYPAASFGGLDYGYSKSTFYPDPSLRLSDDGRSVALMVERAGRGFFTLDSTNLPANGSYVLNAFVPLTPQDWTYDDRITLRIENPTTRTLTVARLALELEAFNVQFTLVAVNDAGFTNYQAPVVPANLYLDKPHVRMILNNLALRPGGNVIRIHYEDLESPVVHDFGLFADRFLRQRLEVPSDDKPFEVTRTVFVAGRATDNAIVKEATLIYQPPGTLPPQEFRMEPVAGKPEWYVAELPRGFPAGLGSVQVRVQDGKDQFKSSEPLKIEISADFLGGGDVILFVFSVVLCLSTAFIYLKVRKKSRTG
jgi:hypothetical protein